MEHIGRYKGYDVYKIPKAEMKYDTEKKLYAVAETGELVLKGEVVGKVAFSSGTVTEYDDHRCYKYQYPVEREAIDMDNRRKYAYGGVTVDKSSRGKRREAPVIDDVMKSVVVDPTDLDKMIDDFMAAARKATIEDYVGQFKEA